MNTIKIIVSSGFFSNRQTISVDHFDLAPPTSIESDSDNIFFKCVPMSFDFYDCQSSLQ